jgi:phage terminase Nu1 subunit (DNA packaging protein)
MPNPAPLVTPCGTLAGSNKALITLLHIGKGTLRNYRDQGAPGGLELAAWHQWLSETGRSVVAARITQYLPRATKETPDTDEGPAADGIDEAVWKARRARAQAKREELALAEAEGKVIARSRAVQVVRRLGQVVVEQLAPGIWPDLIHSLHAATPDTRQACRRAHDAAVLALRQRLVQAAEQVLLELAR